MRVPSCLSEVRGLVLDGLLAHGGDLAVAGAVEEVLLVGVLPDFGGQVSVLDGFLGAVSGAPAQVDLEGGLVGVCVLLPVEASGLLDELVGARTLTFEVGFFGAQSIKKGKHFLFFFCWGVEVDEGGVAPVGNVENF